MYKSALQFLKLVQTVHFFANISIHLSSVLRNAACLLKDFIDIGLSQMEDQSVIS